MYNGNMGKTVPNAFTLIELLVVITVMAITGIFTLANYRFFGEDQNLKNAALDIQSFLRLAQTNATSGIKCQGQGQLGWLVAYTGNTGFDLKCRNSAGISSSVKTLSLAGGSNNISIDSVKAGESVCPVNTTFTFAPLTGIMSSSCGLSPGSLITITLKNSKISSNCSDLSKCKTVLIERGGRIYGE